MDYPSGKAPSKKLLRDFRENARRARARRKPLRPLRRPKKPVGR